METRLALSSREHALDFMGLEWHSEWQWVKVKTDQTNINYSEIIVQSHFGWIFDREHEMRNWFEDLRMIQRLFLIRTEFVVREETRDLATWRVGSHL
mgnify:FL=1